MAEIKTNGEIYTMHMYDEVPDTFWSLFRSVNRNTYVEALLYINEEYRYNNYFLTREVCIQVLSDMNLKKRIELKREEDETEFDLLETPSSRILNWLIKTGWLKKIEDYNTLVTNIVIPDYSAVFIDAFERLTSEDLEETEIYIQNVYATLFSFKNDYRVNLNMLRTALINTRKLNKALQDMLHNMDKFFSRLLEQKSYGKLLEEHLEGYVEEIVRKKYHILKTSDNFYIYKMDIKKVLGEMREDDDWIQTVRSSSNVQKNQQEDVLELLDMIERGFDDIEHRIANLDKEHMKYVRATVVRLNYLLSGETDTKGLMVQLLNHIADSEENETMVKKIGTKMNLSFVEILSEKSLYKRRRGRQDFISQMLPEEAAEDLHKNDILRLNRVQSRYSQGQIEEFIESNMKDDIMEASSLSMDNMDMFEKLILAYDLCTRRNSRYIVLEEEPKIIEKCGYRYPDFKFVRRRL